MALQLFQGSLILGLCSAIHIAIHIYWIGILLKRDLSEHPMMLSIYVGITFVIMILSHTLQVWAWAIALLWNDALPNLSDAVYFSLVTYTTVGYGDVTLEPNFRILGAMASVTGLFNFGLSTAFQVSLLSRLFPKHLS